MFLKFRQNSHVFVISYGTLTKIHMFLKFHRKSHVSEVSLTTIKVHRFFF